MEALFSLFDQYPAIPVGLFALVMVMGLPRRRNVRKEKQAKRRVGILEQALFWFSQHEPFTVRSLTPTCPTAWARNPSKSRGRR